MSLSQFQTLPPHVVQMVVDYIPDRGHGFLYDEYDNSKENMARHMALLWISSNFRAIVQLRYCRALCLQLIDKTSVVESAQASWPFRPKELGYPTHHFAKELSLELSMPCICSGQALKMLSHAPYNGCAFPLVRSITFNFIPPPWRRRNYIVASRLRTNANFSAFVQWIKEMAPRLDKVNVAVHEYSPYRSQSTIQDFSSLVSQLFQLASRIEYNTHIETAPMELQLKAVRNLVHINCSCFDNSDEAVQLARQSASTLQVLSIKMHLATDIPGLIHDGDGKYVEYPCLYTLKLECHRALRLSPRPVFGGASFFPRLRRLNIKADYPFGDDTLFRGNAATLEYLNMAMDPEMVSMFKKYDVFTPTSHPNLQCVEVGDIQDLISTHFATSVEYTQFVLGIAPKLSVLTIYGVSASLTFQPVLSLLGEHTSIRVLRLPLTSMCLWDALVLIKSLPLLTHLYTMSTSLGTMPAGMNLDMLPMYMCSTYTSMCNRFRYWGFEYSQKDPSKDVVTCVLLLVLVCPSFDHSALEYRLHRSFMAQIKMAMAMRGYEHYSPRLHRSLYIK
ncbi:hypothetical protein GGI17_003039 [Coemansia sp. S146]|nr:hypothetical protein GGI17_003039 [Coemansia sp. S146]